MPDDVSTDTASIGALVTRWDGPGVEHRYLPPYSVEKYNRLYVPKNDACRLAIIPSGEASVIRPASRNERRLSLVGLRDGNSGGKTGPIDEKHAAFMDKPLIQSYEKVQSERRLASLMTQSSRDGVVLEGATLHFWYDGSDFLEE